LGKEMKEIRLRSNTEAHDINVKLAHVEKFLLKGLKVRISIALRGRENAHADTAINTLQSIADVFNDIAGCDYPPRLRANIADITLTPRTK